MSRPWRAGASTGLGSLPGTDPVQASQLVLGEVPDLPYLPELPARGLGADLVGRSVALLVDMPMEWQPHGWTMTSSPGRDLRTASDWLRWDLDAFTELAQDAPVVKVQVCGPVSMAASVELTGLHKVLTDHGAFADLSASLAEGTAQHLRDLAGRLPNTAIVLQVDEPSLPAALAGQIPTPSGYGTVRSLDIAVARAAITDVLAAASAGHRALHCCAASVPVRFLAECGADAIAMDLSLLGNRDLDVLGELVEAGVSLWLGVAPSLDAHVSLADLTRPLETLWQRLGLGRELLADAVVATPACGQAGASLRYVRRVMSLLTDVGQWMVES